MKFVHEQDRTSGSYIKALIIGIWTAILYHYQNAQVKIKEANIKQEILQVIA